MKRSARSRLSNIHRHDPRCYWCAVLTVLPDRVDTGRALSANTATTDHIFSRLTVEREKGRRDFVLACNGCNQWRGQVECKLMSARTRAQALEMIKKPNRRPFVRDPFPDGLPNISPRAVARMERRRETEKAMSRPRGSRVINILKRLKKAGEL